MSDLEQKLIQLVKEFNRIKGANLERDKQIEKKDSEIEKLRRTINIIKKETAGTASERYRLRHLEKQRKLFSKKLNLLLGKLQSMEEYLSNEK